MNRKSFLSASLAAILGLGAVATSLSIGIQDSLAKGSAGEWTHFAGVAPTISGKGTREYWVNCSDYQHVFEKPSSSSIQEGEALTRSFVDSLPEGDDRLVPSYAETIGFEDGNVPSIFSTKYPSSTFSIVDGGVGGGKCLKIASSGNFGISAAQEYLDAIFADPEIQSIFFYAKATTATNNFRVEVQGIDLTYELNNTGYGLDTNWKTFEFTREEYEDRVSTDAMIYGYLASGADVYIDGFTPSKKALDTWGFENGYINTTNKYIKSAGHADNRYDCYVASESIFSYSGSYVTSSGYSYDIKTEGLRSLTFTKTNGYLALFLASDIKTKMGDGGRVTFDMYSTVSINSNPTVKNLMDGMNKELGSDGYFHPANQWTTYSFDADNITDDGRFLIIQGSTAGDFYFDNIRIESSTSEVDAAHLCRNIFLVGNEGDEGTSTSFEASYSPSSIAELMIDGVRSISQNAAFIQNGKLWIPNSGLKSLSMGDHKIAIRYFDESGALHQEIYYVNIYAANPSSAVSTTLSYGSASYYQLPGTYENLYRVLCNGTPVPFERIDGGSTYSIPESSLIECLESENGSKKSGTINLFLIMKDSLEVQPISITLSGAATAKEVTEYNGEEMTTYAYSATSHDHTNQTNAEAVSMDKIVEYANVGFPVLYEQVNHVTVYQSAVSDDLRLELDNAAKVGAKVLLEDDVWTVLCRSTTSILGTDVKIGNNTYHWNTTDELDAYVESRLSLYIDDPAVYGVSVGDEESLAQLLGGYGEIFQSLKRVRTKLGHDSDFFLGSNLLPLSAGDDRLTTDGSTTDHLANYINYLNTYLDVTGNDYICSDYYPLENWPNNGSDHDGTGLKYYTIRTLEAMAQVARDRGVAMYYITQSIVLDSNTVPGSNTRILNYEDSQYLVQMLLGYGVKSIRYFTFYHRGSSTGTENWNADGCMMSADGNREDYYYYVKSSLEQAKAMSKILSTFDYQWSHIDRKNTDLINAYAYTYVYENQTSASTYQKLSDYSIDQSWAMFYGLHNSETDQYMYGVQNIHSKADQSSVLETITLTFKDSDISYFAVYEGGSVRVVTATNYFISYRRITLKLSSGNAAFVVPYH